MAFRLIKNRAQDIAVKGGGFTIVASVLLGVLKILPIDITMPFLLLWIMIWFIGASINSKSDNETE
jgi:hypothetical protein